MISDLPPKIWLPSKPAIIRPAPIQRANFVPGMFPGLMMAAAAGGTPQETGFTLVGAGATVDTGGSVWSNPGNITADDGSNATCSVGSGFGGTTGDTLRGSTLGFSIPGGATIDGIELRLQLSYTAVIGGVPTIASVNLGKDDSTLATAKTPGTSLTTTPTNYDFGGSADSWGLSWTPAEINASTFQGLLVAANAGFGATVNCDAMWMNVHFTA